MLVPALSLLAVQLAVSGSPDLLAVAGLESGPHAVGFESIRLRDASRRWPATGDPEGVRGRPIRVALWYPARASAGEPLDVEGYLRADGAGLPLARTRFERAAGEALDDAQWARLLGARGRARPDLRPVAGKRPLLLFASSLRGRSYDFLPLAEVLASHGWVVAALASEGPAEGERPGFDVASLRAQAADLRLARSALGERPVVDATRVALLGWSVGGVSQALLRLEEPEGFEAAVSLDSGTGYAYGAELLREAGGFDPERLRVPFLHFDVGRADVVVEKSDAFLRAHLDPPGRRVLLPELRHGDIAFQAGLGPALAREEPAPRGLRDLAEKIRRFLDEHLPATLLP